MRTASVLASACLLLMTLGPAPTVSACVDIDPGYTHIQIIYPAPFVIPIWVSFKKDPTIIVIDCLAYAEQTVDDLRNS